MRLLLTILLISTAVTQAGAQWKAGGGIIATWTSYGKTLIEPVEGCSDVPWLFVPTSSSAAPQLRLERDIAPWIAVGLVASYHVHETLSSDYGYAFLDSNSLNEVYVNEQMFYAELKFQRIQFDLEIPIRLAWELRLIPLFGVSTMTGSDMETWVEYSHPVGSTIPSFGCRDSAIVEPGQTEKLLYSGPISNTPSVYFHLGLGVRYDIKIGDRFVVSPMAQWLVVPNRSVQLAYGMASLGATLWYKL